MINRAGVTITYDYDNRPAATGTTSFVYDSSGQRVKKITPGTTITYVGKHYECTNGVCKKYVFAGSQRVAVKTNTGTWYYHPDHLGSSSIVTDNTGNKSEEIYYYPFGGTRTDTGSVSVKHKFTGQERDDETGLYYYGARYYDPQLGRFISADSIVQAPFDPQTLNRYSYCRNNPIIYSDPSGHWFIIDDLIAAGIGALVGAVSAAINGEDIGQGALTGAISGALIYAGGVLGGAAAGAINSSIQGGDVGQGALYGALGAAAGIGMGLAMGPIGFNITDQYAQAFASIAGGGLVGGGVTALAGGDFGQGFVNGAIGGTTAYLANMGITEFLKSQAANTGDGSKGMGKENNQKAKPSNNLFNKSSITPTPLESDLPSWPLPKKSEVELRASLNVEPNKLIYWSCVGTKVTQNIETYGIALLAVAGGAPSSPITGPLGTMISVGGWSLLVGQATNDAFSCRQRALQGVK
jgi:RHS repeat-associated protein